MHHTAQGAAVGKAGASAGGGAAERGIQNPARTTAAVAYIQRNRRKGDGMSLTAEITAEIRKLFPQRFEEASREAAQQEHAERKGRVDRIAEAEAALLKALPGLQKTVAAAKAKRETVQQQLANAEEDLRAAMAAERTARIRFDQIRSTENAALRRGAPDRIGDELHRLERLLPALNRIPMDVLEVRTIHGPMSSRTVEILDHAKRNDELARIKAAREALQELTESAPADWDEAINSVLEPVAGMLRKACVR